MHDFTKLYRMDLPHRAIAVYIYLADRANKDGICWPSIPTISRDLLSPNPLPAVPFGTCGKRG